MTMDATVKAIANFNPITPDIKKKPSGLINGEDVKNAMIGLHGRVVVNIPIRTAVVPQAHNGVNAPNNTLAKMDIFFLRKSNLLSLSEFTYVFKTTANTIAKSRTFQLCCSDVPNASMVFKKRFFTYTTASSIFISP
jgi:hypothetical protein